jgi:16S rRNA (guanine527-N7)-methyltransferase
LRYVFHVLPELSPTQRSILDAYEALLREPGVKLGLIAASDVERLGERHIRDSLRAAALLSRDDSLVCDIGPGAGLPGLVLAIARPDIRIVLVEPKERAVGFLELAVERLNLHNAEIHHSRIEEVELAADVATARAFGPLRRSWRAALRVLRPGGRLIYFAGETLQDPEGAARSIKAPEEAASVKVEGVIPDVSPLVIMTRKNRP